MGILGAGGHIMNEDINDIRRDRNTDSETATRTRTERNEISGEDEADIAEDDERDVDVDRSTGAGE